jgi:hypothetical protein
MTEDNCSAPMTLVFAVGQAQRKRGEYARPLKGHVSGLGLKERVVKREI